MKVGFVGLGIMGAPMARDSGRAVAEASDIVILMVPDTPDVAQGLSPGKLVIDMSSIPPTATTDFANRINDLGCDYLDAPVSGGSVGAVNGALTIMVGGPQAAFDRALPLFELMGGAAASTILENHGARMLEGNFEPGFRAEL